MQAQFCIICACRHNVTIFEHAGTVYIYLCMQAQSRNTCACRHDSYCLCMQALYDIICACRHKLKDMPAICQLAHPIQLLHQLHLSAVLLLHPSHRQLPQQQPQMPCLWPQLTPGTPLGCPIRLKGARPDLPFLLLCLPFIQSRRSDPCASLNTLLMLS